MPIISWPGMPKLNDKEWNAQMEDMCLSRCLTSAFSGMTMPVGGLSGSAALFIAYVMPYAKANNFSLEQESGTAQCPTSGHPAAIRQQVF